MLPFVFFRVSKCHLSTPLVPKGRRGWGVSIAGKKRSWLLVACRLCEASRPHRRYRARDEQAETIF